MSLRRHQISIATVKPIDLIEVTPLVQDFVKREKLQEGLLLLASPHTTLGLIVNERCEKLERDIIAFLKKMVPAHLPYHHNEGTIDGRPNAHSHLLSLLLPNQVTIVVSQGKLCLGRWQSLFAVELDGPRDHRELQLTYYGELDD